MCSAPPVSAPDVPLRVLRSALPIPLTAFALSLRSARCPLQTFLPPLPPPTPPHTRAHQGTLDFEEFCLLMLRQRRAAAMPTWLCDALAVSHPGADPPPDAARPPRTPPPIILDLGVSSRRPDGASHPVDVRGAPLPPPAPRSLLLMVADLLPSARSVRALHLGGYGPVMGPFAASEIARSLFQTRSRVRSLDLSNDAIGDEGACAVAAAIERSHSLVSVNLASNGIGEPGATALLQALRNAAQGTPTPSRRRARAASTSAAGGGGGGGGGGGVGGGVADQGAGGLQYLQIEQNPIPAELHAALHEQLLLNQLPRLFQASVAASAAASVPLPPPHQQGPLHASGWIDPAAGATDGVGGRAGDDHDAVGRAAPAPAPARARRGSRAALAASLAARVPDTHSLLADAADALARPSPAAALTDEWLSGSHAAALLVQIMSARLATLSLSGCKRFGGAGLAALVAPATSAAAPLGSLLSLSLSSCSIDDDACMPLAAAITSGHLASLRAIALDGNRLTLSDSFPAATAVATTAAATPAVTLPRSDGGDEPALAATLGCALGEMTNLTDLNLASNPIADAEVAVLCTALLIPSSAAPAPAPAPASVGSVGGAGAGGSTTMSSLRCLHLGSTGAGAKAAAACAQAFRSCGASLQLTALCLSSAIDDDAAVHLAVALPHCPSLRELALGDAITTRGLRALVRCMRRLPPLAPGEQEAATLCRAAEASEATSAEDTAVDAVDATGAPPLPPPLELSSLVLGGEMRSRVILRNELDADSVTCLAELTRSNAALRSLRLSGNVGIGGDACTRLLGALQACQPKQFQLRTLHIDHCGLQSEHVPSFLGALEQVSR